MCLGETKPSVKLLNIGCIEYLNFSSVLGYHKPGSPLAALKVAGISEGKESFTYRLIRLMCGTHAHPHN